MKNKFFLLVIFCLFGSTSLLYSVDTIKILNIIKERYSEYNKTIHKCSQKEYNIMNESTEGGQLILYVENKKVKKITAILYGEFGKSVNEYYVLDQQVFFVLKSTFLYQNPIYEGKVIVKEKSQSRFYFYNNKMIRYLNQNNRIINPKSTEFNEFQKRILSDYNKYLAYLK